MNRVIICANKKLPLLFENYCDSYLGNGFSNGKCENCPFCDHSKKYNIYFDKVTSNEYTVNSFDNFLNFAYSFNILI